MLSHNFATTSKIQKVAERVSPKVLMSDLERYCQEAVRLGDSDARIIAATDVIIDERVLMKCIYPKCRFYGTNANCPPHSVKPEQMREVVRRFHYGVLLTLQTPPETVVGDDVAAFVPPRLKVAEIVAKLEATAFYDGYYLALGFSGGSCKGLFCPTEECSVLTGQGCRVPLRARSSMEAVGMDAFLMATRMGWDIYPCGGALKPEDVPFGRRLGLVLIY